MPDYIWDVIELAEFFEKGLAPLPGGVISQMSSFLDGCRIYWSERAKIEAMELEKYRDRN